MALYQSFHAQMVVQCRPFDAVARADVLAVFPLRLGRVQQRRIIRQRHGEDAAVNQLNRQGVGGLMQGYPEAPGLRRAKAAV